MSTFKNKIVTFVSSRVKIYLIIIILLLFFVCIIEPEYIIPSIILLLLLSGYSYWAFLKKKKLQDKQNRVSYIKFR